MRNQEISFSKCQKTKSLDFSKVFLPVFFRAELSKSTKSCGALGKDLTCLFKPPVLQMTKALFPKRWCVGQRPKAYIIFLALTLLPNSPKYVFLKNKCSWNNSIWMLLNGNEESYCGLTFATKLTFPRARHLYSGINVLTRRAILQLLCTLILVSL